MNVQPVEGFKQLSTPKKVAAVAVPTAAVAATVVAGLKGKQAPGIKGFIKGIPAGYKMGFDKVATLANKAKDAIVKLAVKAKDGAVELFNKVSSKFSKAE